MRTIYCRVFTPNPYRGFWASNCLTSREVQEIPFRGYRGELQNGIRHLSIYCTYDSKYLFNLNDLFDSNILARSPNLYFKIT